MLPAMFAEFKSLDWKPGFGSVKPTPDGKSRFVQVVGTVAPAPKPLQEVKGFVVSEYQDHLEKQWIESTYNINAFKDYKTFVAVCLN